MQITTTNVELLDEGARYDAEMTDRVFAEATALYRRTLGWTR
jgi:hypothetical protein